MKIGNSFDNAWGGQTIIIHDTETKPVDDSNHLHSCETHVKDRSGTQIIKYLVIFLVGYLIGAGF